MGSMTFELVIIIALVFANGIFAMAEIALVSARKGRIQQLANEGNTRARAALDLANDPGDFLSTVQVGITLIGILAGAFGGATVAAELTAKFREIPGLEPYSHALGLGLVVLGITYLSLIIGELVPKQLALNNPERIAIAMAPLMRLLSRLAFPVVWVLSTSTDAVLRFLQIRPSAEPPVTEAEIHALLQQGTQAGVLEPTEHEMMRRVLRLGDRRVEALMTPRPEIVWLDPEAPREETHRRITESAHSRFLVARESLDHVLGVVQAKNLLAHTLTDQPIDLHTTLEQPLYVPESMQALLVLERFKESGTHTALVVNEYGGLEGLVTPTDILEAIVGDIPGAGEAAEPSAVRREDGSWLVDGMMPVDEFKDLFRTGPLPGEEEHLYQTVAGFVILQLGHIPVPAEHFDWAGWRFEVMDMDGHRIDKMLITPLASSVADGDAKPADDASSP
jgi:putative hemolysin